ncbi:peroxiredoxin [uncultured Chitinophaga sp.]|jgi:Peroxiredoxin|uniref:peroxiredoxin n=1 Tax=uncultured Chitinophaga sp. TaxID=339340 RepID=UPI00260D2956|nr:peroxiredoxin [uncultured Chitinophaga sp.]
MRLNIKKASIIAMLAMGCSLTFIAPAVKAQETMMQETLHKGDKAPDFSLKDQDGNTFNLSDVVGKKKLVIFFYPKDESPVCTKEACAFRDAYQKFNDADAMVIGINNGTIESHKAFAKKNHLPFTLLSDPGNAVLNKFGIKDQDFGNNVKVSGRETFVIGLDGTIVYSFRDFMKGDEHSKQVLAYLAGK